MTARSESCKQKNLKTPHSGMYTELVGKICCRQLLRLAQGSLFWMEFIRTDLVGVKKLLVSFSDSFSNSSLVISFVSGFNSFSSSL